MIISKLHYTKLQRQLIFLLPLFFCVEIASAQIADDDWLIVSGGGQTKEQMHPEIDHALEATTVEAERITGVRGKYAEAEGGAVIIRGVQELRGNYLFYDQIKDNKPITITDPKMTRFMMSLDNAVELVLYAFQNGNTGDIFVQKAPSTTIGELAETMKTIYNSNTKIKNIGIRHGEKIHETLLSQEERIVSEDLGDYFRIPADNRDLNYDKYFSKGVKAPKSEEFNSFNTVRLEKQELINLLSSIGYK